MILIAASPCSSHSVYATNKIAIPRAIPSVCHRPSPPTSRSSWLMARGSSNTSTAVSKLSPCFARFARFFLSSHSKYIIVTAYLYIQYHLTAQRVDPVSRRPPSGPRPLECGGLPPLFLTSLDSGLAS